MKFRHIITGSESRKEIDRFCHLGDGEGSVFLTRAALLKIIDRFLAKEISDLELEEIAETLDANDSVVFEDEYRHLITDGLFSLSSTEINGPLDVERVLSVRATINRS